MSDSVDRLFGNFRPTAFKQDPNEVPQQLAGGAGNPAPQGWLDDNSVTADVIQASAVTADKIQAGAVVAGKIAAGSITSTEIAATTIQASNIAANTITSGQIAANAITATQIAADAVTTNKILAANVISSKIELTISGKKFSGTSGTQAAPGYTFDSGTDTGMYYDGVGLNLVNGNVPWLIIGNNAEIATNRVVPQTDNTFLLGKSGKRWTAVWAVNGTIQTSDERLKKDIADTPLGLDFIRSLKARVFRWKDTPDTQADEEAEFDQEGLLREIAPLQDRIVEIRKAQLAKGTDTGKREVASLQKKINAARIRYMTPVIEARSKRRSGRRLHHGLIAQEVKQALDAAGVGSQDAAFWSQAPDGTQSLVYTELIAPLIRAVQELAAEVEELRQR